jgi:hypothetical protein
VDAMFRCRCGLEWQKKEGREKLVSATRAEEIVIYSAKVN